MEPQKSVVDETVDTVKSFFRWDSRARLPRAEVVKEKEPVKVEGKRAPQLPGLVHYEKQNFYTLREELFVAGKLFEDPLFPATQASIYYSTPPPTQGPIEWKRPSEFVKDPRFVVGDANRFDVEQGALGDCWLLASVASLSIHPELLERVAPRDQDFVKEDGFMYAGIFHFRFWYYGTWTDVVVDDRLPTCNGQLVYMHSVENNEFWSALLEKAYAKLFGSYEALKGGSSSEAMVDFTGGVTETFDLREKTPPNLFPLLLKAVERCSLMGASIDPDPKKTESVLSNGLVMGHAYSVTGVKQVKLSDGTEAQLIRLRNPWGNETEWKGAWSDSSSEWRKVPEEERKAIGLTFDDDGEFWMSFADFSKWFQHLEICSLGPDSLDSNQLRHKQKTRWEQVVMNNQWIPRSNAGGCRNYINTFWTNPQYRVTVTDPDAEDDDNTGTLIVGLMQKNRRQKRIEGGDLLTIGYIVYKLDENTPDTPLDISFFKRHASCARSPSFTNTREMSARHKLAPGKYVIVPSTFEPDKEAEFLLRLYAEKTPLALEADEKSDLQAAEPEKAVAEAAADPRAEEAIKTAFAKIAGEDGEIDAYELRAFLNAAFKRDFPFDGFSLECCRSMVALYDADLTGKLGLDEFKLLWADLRLYRAVFKRYDADGSGRFNTHEMRNALRALGMSVSNCVFQSIVMRYSNSKGEIEFDDFVLLILRLKTVFANYRAQRKDAENNAVFKLEEFVQIMMYI